MLVIMQLSLMNLRQGRQVQRARKGYLVLALLIYPNATRVTQELEAHYKRWESFKRPYIQYSISPELFEGQARNLRAHIGAVFAQ